MRGAADLCLPLMTDAIVRTLQTCLHLLAVDACMIQFAQSGMLTASRLHYDTRLLYMHKSKVCLQIATVALRHD